MIGSIDKDSGLTKLSGQPNKNISQQNKNDERKLTKLSEQQNENDENKLIKLLEQQSEGDEKKLTKLSEQQNDENNEIKLTKLLEQKNEKDKRKLTKLLEQQKQIDKNILQLNENKNENKNDELTKLLEQKKQIDKNILQQIESNDEDYELKKLLEQKKQIEENQANIEKEEERLRKESEQHIEDTYNNLNIFVLWIKDNLTNKDNLANTNDLTNKDNLTNKVLYKSFTKSFSTEYRTHLFENICEFFKNETFVTNEILFYWKYIVIHLLQHSKKYKSRSKKLTFDISNFETNLRLVKEKYIFKCFIGDRFICYFKENGNDYYVS